MLEKKMPVSVVCFFIVWFIFSVFSLTYISLLDEGIKHIIYNTSSASLFIALYLFSFKASMPCISVIWGWTLIVFFTSPVAFWEIISGNHLSFNLLKDVMLDSGQRIYASVAFGNLNSYVVCLIYCLPFILTGLFSVSKSKRMFWIALLIASTIIIINASRGGILCLILSTVVFLISVIRDSNIKKSHVFSSLLFIAIIIICFADTLFSQITGRFSSVEGIAEDAGRLIIYANCITIFINTFGFGCGIGNLTHALENVSSVDIAAPHNLFLEFLAEYGVIPSIFFIIMLFQIIKRLATNRTKAIKMLGIIIAVIIIPLSLIDSGYISGTHIWIFLSSLLIMSRHNNLYFSQNSISLKSV